jgi:hypothetical protein
VTDDLRAVLVQNLGTMIMSWNWNCSFCAYKLKVESTNDVVEKWGKFCFDEVRSHKDACEKAGIVA